MDIVVVGSLNVDSVVKLARFPVPGETVTGLSHALFPGGKGGNQAYAAARLVPDTTAGGPAIAVHMLGQVGGDSHASWLVENLRRGGVDVSAITTDEAVSSGIAVIATDEHGQNQIVIVPGANGSFSPERLERHHARLADAALVLLQLEVPLETVRAAAQHARAAGARVILDPAPARPLPDELLKCCEFVTPNENELRALLGQTPASRPLSQEEALAGARRLLVRGARQVIVKMGAAGALWMSPNRHAFFPAPTVTAVDTTAAGDTFNAALAVALATGEGVADAARFACAAASLSVMRAGAQPSMPTRAEVLTFMNG